MLHVISSYHLNIQNDVRKTYLKKVPINMLILIFFEQLTLNKGFNLTSIGLVY